MRETERRIQRYEARLPRVREKIFASLALFGLALSMLTVATFSWITLSVAPEVGNITTTIAANGNLEIALVDADAKTPSESLVGDGDATNSIQKRNIAWGNLINLSDPGYGLDKITLRPASLNTENLLNEPLFAATYTLDGRVTKLNSDFKYTAYNPTTNTFDQSNNRGIRAISYVEYEKVEYKDPLMAGYLEAIKNATNLIREARLSFNGIGAKGSTKMDPVVGLIGTYTNTILSSSGDPETDAPWTCVNSDVEGFYDLLVYVDQNVFNKLGEAFMMIFEIYQTQTDNLKDKSGLAVNYTPKKFENLDDFCAGAAAELAEINRVRQEAEATEITFASLSIFLADRVTLKQDLVSLETIKSLATIYWTDVDDIIFHLVKVDTVTLKGKTMSQWFSSLRDNIWDLVGILGGSYSENLAIVHDGMLERLDKMLHNGDKDCFYAEEVVIKFSNAALQKRAGNFASMVKSYESIKASVKTDAVKEQSTPLITIDFAEVNEVIAAPAVDLKYTAKETYGLSLDFWVRTNNPGAYLTLEGDVETEGHPIFETVEYTPEGASSPVTLDDVQIFTATVVYKTSVDYLDESKTDENYESSLDDQDIFSVTENGNKVWYLKSNGQHIPIGSEETDLYDDNADNPTKIGTQKLEVSFKENPQEKLNYTVIGYSGANRVWKEEDLPFDYDPTTSTTQGSGSCYTFYADTPEDMEQSLELISALRVAFVDNSTGSLLAEGYFDTEKYFAEYGEVIVPLYLTSSADTVETLEATIPVITQLPKNTPMMITAIIYLDGSKITNDKVLSASEIDGTMNIQFGSYTRPDAMGNDNLVNEVRTIEASLAQDYKFTGDMNEDRTVSVNLDITGSEPQKISGYFVRVISQTHGSRHETFEFTRNEDGTWTGSVVLDVPGEFVLRSVLVDGLEYKLTQEKLPAVEVPGFSVQSVSGEKGDYYVYRTAENYVTEKFDIVVASGPNGWPKSVKSIFQGEDGATITTNYTGSGANWAANITFNSSDTYTMSYVVVDGEYFEITPIVREINTGLYTEVKLQIADTYTEEEEREVTSKGITYYFIGEPHEFAASVKIFDNSGKELKALGNVKLYYSGNLDADLTWNEAKGCYDGESFMIKKPGLYSFDFVTVSGEVIDRATSTTTITAATRDPVEYVGIANAVDDYVVDLDGGTASEITLEFAHAQAASVYGLFAKSESLATIPEIDVNKQSKDATYFIMIAQNNGDADTHTFRIPAEDGYFTLIDVKVATVFDGKTETFFNGNENVDWPDLPGEIVYIDDIEDDWLGMDEFTDADGNAQDYYYDIDDLKYQSDVRSTKVVASIQSSNNFAPKTFTGSFMQEYTVSGLNISFFDFEGDVLKEEAAISNVQLKFTYGDNHEDYGGYDSATITASSGSFNVDLTPDASNKVFTQSADATVIYAGTYSSDLYYTVGKETIQRTLPGPNLTVDTTTPSALITAITPTGSNPTKITYTLSSNEPTFSAAGNLDSVINTADNTATVYALPTIDNSTQKHGSFTRPTLTVTIAGVESDSEVSLVLPAGSSNAITFKRTGNGTITNTLGSVSQINKWTSKYLFIFTLTHTLDAYYGHGTQTITTMTVVQDGVTYTITLDKPIVINNPNSVNQ